MVQKVRFWVSFLKEKFVVYLTKTTVYSASMMMFLSTLERTNNDVGIAVSCFDLPSCMFYAVFLIDICESSFVP